MSFVENSTTGSPRQDIQTSHGCSGDVLGEPSEQGHSSPSISSSEDEIEVDPLRQDEIMSILEPPLDESERARLNKFIFNDENGRLNRPEGRYADEFIPLHTYLTQQCHSLALAPNPTPFGKFPCRLSYHRLDILTRAIIRKRWEKLGVWVDRWTIVSANGFGIVTRPNRMPWYWYWSVKPMTSDWCLYDWGTSLARIGLRRSDCLQIPPQSIPSADSSRSLWEAFHTSRPWYQFEVEQFEERCRRERLNRRERNLPLKPNPVYASVHERWEANGQRESFLKYNSVYASVRERWEANGRWKDTWKATADGLERPGWRWPNESPSPEPEDLERFVNIGTVGFTQKELNELDNTPTPISAPEHFIEFPTVEELLEEANAAVDPTPRQDARSEPGAPATRGRGGRGRRNGKGSAPPKTKTKLHPKPKAKPQAKVLKRAVTTFASRQRKKTAAMQDRTQKRTQNTAVDRRSPRIAAIQAGEQKKK